MALVKFPLSPKAKVITLEVKLISPKITIPVKMVLDTGASLSTVPVEVAIALGLDPAKSKRRIEMLTASGVEYAALVTIPKIEFLGLSLNKVDFICHNLPPQTFVSGLLGINVLKNFDIFLKFRSKILEITK